MMQENQLFTFGDIPSFSFGENGLLSELYLENFLKNEPCTEEPLWMDDFGLPTSSPSDSFFSSPSSSPIASDYNFIGQTTNPFDFLINSTPTAESNLVPSTETNPMIHFEESSMESPFSPAVSSSLPSSPLPSSPAETYHPHLETKSKRKMKRNQLSSWICTQRQDRKSGELPEYRIKLLDLVGFVWSKQHKQQMQHSPSSPTPSNRKSSSVDNLESIEKDILSNSSISSLTGRAQRNHDQWMMRYRELLLFKKKFGHLKVPTLIPA